jgi:hypothetical protein
MATRITVAGRELELSEQSHSDLTYKVTAVDVEAQFTNAGDKNVLISQIALTCVCSGDYIKGTSTFVGNGNAVISANSQGLTCEDQPVLLEGDTTTITCTGSVTTVALGATAPGTASVTVAIANTGQDGVTLG